MSHEQSETIQRPDGRWVNVYGKGLPQAGQQLPGTQDYGDVHSAVSAAQARSHSFDTQDEYDFGSSAMDDHMSTVKGYLRKVQNGRQIKGIDPNQPAFSPEAETIRQAQAVDKANNRSNGDETDPVNEYSFGDTSQGETNPQGYDFSTSDPSNTGISSPRKGTPTVRQTFKANMDRYVPKSLVGKNDPNRDPAQALDPLFQAVTAPLAALRDTVMGGDPRQIADKTFGPPSTDWRKNILPGLLEAGLDLLPALPMMTMGGRSRGNKAQPVGGEPTPPTIPIPIQQSDLDAMVAHRSLTASALDTGAFPDPDLIPLRRVPTGNNLTVPNLDLPQVEHTTSTLGPVERQAKGQFGRSAYPDLLPGEIREGQQGMFGGYPAKDAPMGKTIVTPEEQLPIGMDTLRPQVRTIGPQTSEQAGDIPSFVSKALKTRILTPEMERTLASPPETMGGMPLSLTVSKSGQSIAVELADQGVTIPKDLTMGNTLNGAAYPSLYARVSGSLIDATRSTGPIGQGVADMGEMAYSIRATRSSQAAFDATSAIDSIFGRTTLGKRIKIRSQLYREGENAALTGERAIWGVTLAQEEQAFNYLYTNGRMLPKDPKAKALADAVYEKFLYPASSDPDVRRLPGVLNPFTGKYTPFGQPGKFMPQQPIHPITVDAIRDTQWRILYNRRGLENSGISLEQFKATVVKLSQHNPEVTAAKARGLENMRLLDLESLGGSPYEWAKKLGYRTDIYQAGFHYHSLATLRGQLGRIEEPIKQLIGTLPASEAATAEWLTKAAGRILQQPSVSFDTMTRMTNGIKTASHVMDVTMLQKGLLANMAQGAYIAARGGVRATVGGLKDLLTKKDTELIERSGATYASIFNELSTPSGPLARWSSIAYRMYGISLANRATLYFAGHVGNSFISRIEANLLKDPSNKRLQSLIGELGGDPKVLLQQGKIPDDMRYFMIQRFANYTSGNVDVRGIPLWATSQNPWFKLVNKYRSFALSNSGEIRRAIFQAPTVYDGVKRAVTLLVSAYGLGTGIKSIGTDLINEIMGNNPKQSKDTAWNKIEPMIYGLGTLEGSMIVNTMNDPARSVISLTGGPLASAGVSFLEDMQLTAEHGVGWRTFRSLGSRVPVVGPLVGPYIRGQAKEESKRYAENQRYLHE